MPNTDAKKTLQKEDFPGFAPKGLRRWTRVLLAVIIYSLLVFWVAGAILKDYLFASPSIYQNQGKRIVLGLSLIEGEPSTVLSDFGAETTDKDWSTSFLLQSQSPTVQVFLDYIAIHNDPVIPASVCFKSISLLKNETVPLEVVSEIVPLKKNLGNLTSDSRAYIFTFDSKVCLDKGRKYVMPHLFLGVLSVDAYADLRLTTISGNRAFEFFPFEEQKIPLDVSILGTDGEDDFIIPRLEATVSQQGWVGKFIVDENKNTTLHLTRPRFYRNITLIFLIVLAFIALSLNNIVDDASSFFEISFGLLLGLWGIHEILIPGYIESSVLIDAGVYILYVFVIGEILVVFIDQIFIDWKKRYVQIIYIEKGGLEKEHVVIKNTSWAPIDMTSWTLADESGHKYKFPPFILRGNNTVRIWTVEQKNLSEDSKHLVWGRKNSVWNDNQDTAYLEDSKGEAISTRSYKPSI